jgi:hypothetical protein
MKTYASKLAGMDVVRQILQNEHSHLGIPISSDETFKKVNSNNKIIHERYRLRTYDVIDSSMSPTTATITLNDLNSIPINYIGLSLGAIMGAAWTAYAPHFRSVLIAGGSSFSFIIGRSDFLRAVAGMARLQFYER